MRKIKLYIAISLNGKIARANGDVDWLETIPTPQNEDYGYAEFYDSIDTTIQGRSTYQQLINWGIPFPYKDKINYVITSKSDSEDNDDVKFMSGNYEVFIKDLLKQKGKDIWLVGGGKINTLLLNSGLIDEMYIFVMPIIIPDGIDLFGNVPKEKQMEFVDSKTYENGVVYLKYKSKK